MCAVDILRRNLYHNKYAKAHYPQQGKLHKLFPLPPPPPPIYCFLFPVTDIKFEKIVPKIDGDNWDSAKEFRFSILPTSEYFTRQDHYSHHHHHHHHHHQLICFFLCTQFSCRLSNGDWCYNSCDLPCWKWWECNCWRKSLSGQTSNDSTHQQHQQHIFGLWNSF